jgi:hypothetical protein
MVSTGYQLRPTCQIKLAKASLPNVSPIKSAEILTGEATDTVQNYIVHI